MTSELPPPPGRREPRVWAMPPSSLGAVLAAGGYLAALGPSLLPRGLTSMVLVGALGGLTGYAVGAVLGALLRFAPVRPPAWLGRGAWLAAAVAWLVAAALTPRACGWQSEQAASLGLADPAIRWPVVVVGSLALLAVCVVLGRLLRLVGRLVAHGIEWFGLGHRWALAAGFIAAAALFAVLLGSGYAYLKHGYAVTDDSTAGQRQPVSALRSGSPESVLAWDQLGREGRFFVSTGPTPEQITAVTGRPAQEPIRLYVGLDEAYTARERADLLLREMNRAGAFKRSTVVVGVVTGTGWFDPDAANSIDVVSNGDVATVAIQYSYLPSWISFIVDKAAAVETGQAEVEAVVGAWRALPEGQRPRLILFGESLGSLGSQGAFASSDEPPQVVADFSGVVWSGPPAESQLWRRWGTERSGGPAWQPLIGDTAIARVGINATQFGPTQAAWGSRRIAFAAHPNDPVVYWDGSIAFHRPAWLDDPRGPGVDPRMTWWPVLTFWQCGIDLISGGSVPPGLGHNYTAELPTMFVGVEQPTGWTEEMTVKLKALLDVLRPESM